MKNTIIPLFSLAVFFTVSAASAQMPGQWLKVQQAMTASSGATIDIEYQVQTPGNSIVATPLYINVNLPSAQCSSTSTVSAVINDSLTYNGLSKGQTGTSQEPASLSNVGGCRFSVGLPANVPMSWSEDGAGYTATHTLVVVVNGYQLQNTNGTNYFPFSL
jgi:hypothetical protein